ncbi:MULTISPECIES: methionine ABC transporter ATP-binding protein [Gordonia]|uniref:methionine ABC transporter ATP-binding protein n=1 Tax=Gordonia TaxID=2053 RepID=UPI00257F4512|nr:MULTISPECIES: methionine ABC transporter ATP-binding protein [Gordonia]
MAPDGDAASNLGSSAGSDTAIDFVGVSKRFDKSGPKVLDGIDLSVRSGEIVGIIGPSGAGKSTLARLINGLERPTSGQVFVHGAEHSRASERELNRLRTDIGMIFQQFNLFNSRTVAGNVDFALKVAHFAKDKRRSRIDELLDFVGSADKADQWPAALSGGQKQRVGIARALATSPSILIADEATSALDPQTTSDTLKLLRRINSDLGTTIVVITHEMDVVRDVCESVAVLDRGRLVDHGDVYSVFEHPTSDVTRGLLRHAVAGVPDADTLATLRARHPGLLATVSVRDDAAASGHQDATFDLPAAVAEHGARSTVIAGGISDIAGRPFGALTYEITGDAPSVDAARAQLVRIDGVVVHEEAQQ